MKKRVPQKKEDGGTYLRIEEEGRCRRGKVEEGEDKLVVVDAIFFSLPLLSVLFICSVQPSFVTVTELYTRQNLTSFFPSTLLFLLTKFFNDIHINLLLFNFYWDNYK